MAAERPRKENMFGQRMGRKGALTRERLMKATAELMEKRSLRELKLSEITALAGASSVSTFYIYFDNVEDCVLAVVEEIEQWTPEFEAILQRPWTHETAFHNARAFVREYIRFWDLHHGVLRFRNLAADEGDRRFLEARHRATLKLMTLLQAKAEAAGVPADPVSVATVIGAFLERLPAITRFPFRRGRSRPRLIDAAALTMASLLTPDALAADFARSPGGDDEVEDAAADLAGPEAAPAQDPA